MFKLQLLSELHDLYLKGSRDSKTALFKIVKMALELLELMQSMLQPEEQRPRLLE